MKKVRTLLLITLSLLLSWVCVAAVPDYYKANYSIANRFL